MTVGAFCRAGLCILEIHQQHIIHKEAEFPLVSGRDFSGEIVEKGTSVTSELQIGQAVWGMVPVQKTGCNAQYVLVHTANVIIFFFPSTL